MGEREQKENVCEALSRVRVAGLVCRVPGVHTASGVVQLNRTEI